MEESMHHPNLRAARRNPRRRGVTNLAFCQCNSIRFGAGKPVSAGIESSLVRSLGPHGWRGNPTDKKNWIQVLDQHASRCRAKIVFESFEILTVFFFAS